MLESVKLSEESKQLAQQHEQQSCKSAMEPVSGGEAGRVTRAATPAAMHVDDEDRESIISLE